jgi:hypothetical protein
MVRCRQSRPKTEPQLYLGSAKISGPSNLSAAMIDHIVFCHWIYLLVETNAVPLSGYQTRVLIEKVTCPQFQYHDLLS